MGEWIWRADRVDGDIPDVTLFHRMPHRRWTHALSVDEEQVAPIVRALLAALPEDDREAVIRQACREAGLRVLTAWQARLLLPAHGVGDPPIGDVSADLAGAVAALRGEEVEDRG